MQKPCISVIVSIKPIQFIVNNYKIDFNNPLKYIIQFKSRTKSKNATYKAVSKFHSSKQKRYWSNFRTFFTFQDSNNKNNLYSTNRTFSSMKAQNKATTSQNTLLYARTVLQKLQQSLLFDFSKVKCVRRFVSALIETYIIYQSNQKSFSVNSGQVRLEKAARSP